jgi:hypothetical protein
MIDGWLILDIAAGIVMGDWLRSMVKDTQIWWNRRRKRISKNVDEKTADELEGDWDFLWNNVPDSAKEEVRKFLEDEELRQRAKDSTPLQYLFYAAPEEAKERLRQRWKAAKIPPRVSG